MQVDRSTHHPAFSSVAPLLDGTEAPPAPLLTREDFAASVRVYRRRHRSPANWMLVAGMPGGLGVGYGLIVAGEQLGPGPAFALPAFLTGWLLALVSGGALVSRERKLGRQWGLECPGCGEALITASDPRRTDLVMATGRCPTCGAAQFAGDDPE